MGATDHWWGDIPGSESTIIPLTNPSALCNKEYFGLFTATKQALPHLWKNQAILHIKDQIYS